MNSVSCNKTVVMTLLGCLLFASMSTINAGNWWSKTEPSSPNDEVDQMFAQAKRIPLLADMFQKAESGGLQEKEQARAKLLGLAGALTKLAQQEDTKKEVAEKPLYCQTLRCYQTQEQCTDHK